MIGLILDLHEHQNSPNDDLRVRQKKNNENKPLEVQLLIRLDAQRVRNSQKYIPENGSHPIKNSTLFGTQKFKSKSCGVLINAILGDKKIQEIDNEEY